MSEYIKTCTFNQAKKLAEEAALDDLAEFMGDPTMNVLDDMYVEAEYCWFFFRNKQIQGPPERVLRWKRAYAVSKKGGLRVIADYSKDPVRLQEYLQIMSNHFKEKGE